jgi:hypothetical protein
MVGASAAFSLAPSALSLSNPSGSLRTSTRIQKTSFSRELNFPLAVWGPEKPTDNFEDPWS